MKKPWKNKLITAGWCTLGAAMVVLLLAAAGHKNMKGCTGIHVEVSGGGDHFFVEAGDVKALLNANGQIAGRAIANIDLWMLEQRLEHDRWIKNAELFIDNRGMLQVMVEENIPVARIFTTGGLSYYIDSSCVALPLNERLSARVPMFTNYPGNHRRPASHDSLLLHHIKEMAVYINSYPFWKAQVAQVNINSNREVELVPTLGNQLVLLGKPADFEVKLNRLYSFYRQVWAKGNMERYDTLDLRYDNQVVASKRG